MYNSIQGPLFSAKEKTKEKSLALPLAYGSA
jgi:hypothetical protein